MKPKLVVALLFLFSLTYSQVQNKYSNEWIKQLGAEYDDVPADLQISKSNKPFITGSFINSLTVDSQYFQSYGSEDFFLAGFNQTGDLLVFDQGGGKGSDIALDMTFSKNDNLFLCGNMTDTTKLGNLTSVQPGAKMFVAKKSTSGQYDWLTTITSAYSSSLYLIGTDDNENVYAGGVFRNSLSAGGFSINSNGGTDFFIVKISSSGTILNLISFGSGGNDRITALAVSPSGKIYIAGLPGGDFYIGDFRVTDDITPDFNAFPFLVCLDSNLNSLWGTQISGEEYCIIQQVSVDQNESILVSGNFNMHLNVADSTFYSGGYANSFLIKYNSDRSFNWARSFGSWFYDYINDATIGSDGTIIVTGSIGDSCKVDNVTLNPKVIQISASYVLTFSADGKASWGDIISEYGANYGEGVNADQFGNIYVTGSFSEKVAADNNSDTIYSQGQKDIFLSYYYKCIDEKNEIAGNNFICPDAEIQLSIPQSFKNVLWNDGISNQNSININTPGLYYVTMTDEHGCFQSDSMLVSLVEVTGFSLGNDTILTINDTLILYAPENFENYTWQDGSTSGSYVVETADKLPGIYQYWLRAEDDLGCLVYDSISIQVNNSTGIEYFGNNKLRLFPVPADDFLNLTLDTQIQFKNLSISLLDLNGRAILNKQINNYTPRSVIQINVEDVSSGTYILMIQYDNKTINGFCVIRH